MTEYEEFYRRLIELDPTLRRQWLLERRPASASPAQWWFSLIDSAVSDVRRQFRGWPAERPRADLALAAALIDWALDDGFPLDRAVEELAELARLALDAGHQVHDLPRNAQPDAIARRALTGFAMTPTQAMTRAASLRATPITEEDFLRPGEDVAMWQALTATADYRDYHRLLNIDRMLTDLTPLVDLIPDVDLANQLRAWLHVQAELDPLPTVDGPDSDTPPPTQEQAD